MPPIPCALLDCARAAGKSRTFCDQHIQDLLREKYVPPLTSLLPHISRSGSPAYIGRSAFPEARLLEHWIDHEHRSCMLVLGWAAGWSEAERLEELLIETAKKHTRSKTTPIELENRSGLSEGSFTSPWNAIYLVFDIDELARTALAGALKIPAVPVRTLHERQRLWPAQDPDFKSVLLYPDVELEAAEDELAWLDAGRTRARERSRHRQARARGR